MLAAKALVSLHICTGSLEPRHSNEISCAGANGDLCAIHASSFCTLVTGQCNKYQYFICWHAAKALASLHICKGSPEPRHRNEVHVSCAGSNGDLCTVYVKQQMLW